MEGGGFFPFGPSHYASSAASFNFLDAEDDGGNREAPIPTNPNNNNGNTRADAQQQRVQIREQDQYMPIANVIRIMRRILPAHAKISDDAKETVQECVSEYISFVTSEANQRCQNEQRKTVTAEDLLWAIRRLGFDNYVDPLSIFLARYRDFDGNGNGNRSAAASGQHVMMAPPQHAPRAPALLAPPYYGSVFPEGPNPMSGYYIGSGSGSGSSSGGPVYYDPYGHLRDDRF